ncbi:MAG: SDR family NAD(P)-dependent oxidoreductase [Ramlibacter sp.]
MADRLKNTVVVLTGAGGGIGTALTEALLQAGVAEIIATGRETPEPQPRVRAELLDVTDAGSVHALAERLGNRVSVVIHCAGVNGNRRLFTPGYEDGARLEMAVNYFGLLNLAAAFAPAMRARRNGVFVNLLSLLSHVNLPHMATYCASKAAAHSLTQALRAELSRDGVLVCGVYPAVVDTSMSSHIPGTKLAPAELAQLIVQGIEQGAEDIFPGPAEAAYRQFVADPKGMERGMAARLP